MTGQNSHEEQDGHGQRRFVEARVGAAERVWAPRSVRIDNGVSVGRRQIDFRSLGALNVTIEPDQFLDLGDASWHGRTVSFVPPSTAPRADGWARRWQGGLLTTCGLSAVGRAGPEDGGMHGRAHLIPAAVTRQDGFWNESGDFELIVCGSLREGAIFAQNVTVHRTVRARHGISEISIADEIRNEGFRSEAVKLLYHVNIGWPMLHRGARFSADAGASDGVGGDRWSCTLEDPEPGVPERVDALVARSDPDGWCRATISGDSGTVIVGFRAEQLPYLTVWRSAASGSYALGIEPGTCWPSHAEGPDEGKAGRVLAPGETFSVELTISFSD